MNTELQKMNNVYANLQSVIMQQGIAALLPAQVTPEQFTRTAATALIETRVSQSPKKKYKFKNKKIRVFIFCPVIHALKISIKHSYK